MDLITLMILFFVIGGVIITAVVMAMEIKKHRPVKAATDADKYIVRDETEMAVMEDTFLRTRTTRRKVASSNQHGAGKR